MPAWARSAAAIDRCPVNWASSPAWMRLVVRHVAEADPRIELGGPDRRVGIAGVGVVDDAEVAAGHRHVVGRGLVRTGHVRHRIGVADDVGSGDVEQQRAGGAGPFALGRPDAEGGEGPAAGDRIELDGVGSSRRRRPRMNTIEADTTRRPGTWRAGRHDRLAEHLAALDHRTAPVAAGGADVAGLAVGLDVEDVDQVGGVAPGGEALGGDVALVVAAPERR